LFAFVAAVSFNLINSVLFDIGIFPWLMLGALLIFFPPDVPRRFARAFMSSGEDVLDAEPLPRPIETAGNPSLSTSQKLVVGLLAAYLAVQVVLPLRHYLYPGNVSWTEEGHNFSWHMKSHQVMKMITKPDLILHFAHYLAELKRLEGYANVEVRARAMVSLNGREPQLLIDPNVDLAKEEVGLLPARWIVPLTTPLGSPK